MEFINNMADSAADEKGSTDNIKALFQKYDKDGSGFLDKQELRSVVSELMGGAEVVLNVCYFPCINL